MATETTITEFTAQPIENDNGTLSAITLSRTERVVRRASDGRVLDSGGQGQAVETITIPTDHLQEVLGELVSWTTYYATGEAARDMATPVSWPNSTATVGSAT